MMDAQAKVLVVDDEALNIEMTSAVLGDEYDILFATNGADAVRIAGEELPDLILLDVVMPGMDGFEVCRALKSGAATRDIPVIFVTALVEESNEAEGLELGAIDYVTKPMRPSIVQARVRNHIELKRSRDMLKKLSDVDGLTGIANRRVFDERLVLEWHRAQRIQTSLGLIFIDIDHFKLFNDTYGHLAGDDCLRRVAEALAGAVARPADLVARYGGEEFVCLMPETDQGGVEKIGQTMLDAVRDLRIPHDRNGSAPIVTISLGGGCLSPRSGDESALFLSAIDQRLYQAKEKGRNQGVFA